MFIPLFSTNVILCSLIAMKSVIMTPNVYLQDRSRAVYAAQGLPYTSCMTSLIILSQE